MKIEITFSRDDVARVKDVVAKMTDHPIVIERRERNVNRRDIDLTHETIWNKHIGCLLTTQQKSSEGSAVQRFIRSKSALLSLRECEDTKDVARMAESELSTFGGIRRSTVISKQIAHNFRWLKAGGWTELEAYCHRWRRLPNQRRQNVFVLLGLTGC